MKKLSVNIIMLICMIFSISAQKSKSSDEILKDVSLKLAEGVEAEFTVSKVGEKNSISEQFSGSILIKGDKYYLNSPDFKIWYNGLDQWSYNISDDEVTVVEVSPIEENSFNIMSIINNQDKYDVRNFGTETLLGKKYTKVVLTTRKPKGEIIFRKVTFLFNQNMMPHSMGVEDKNGENFILLFTKAQINMKLTDNDFVFPRDQYKDAYFNDLR